MQTFLSGNQKLFYVRELVRIVEEQINAVRAELSRMEKAGMVRSENRANRKYYLFRTDFIFYDELLRMVSKTTGLGGGVVKEKGKLGRIRYCSLSGDYMRGKSAGPNEVDLLVVGSVVLPQLAALVKESESKIGREINYTVMSEDEFNFRKKRRDPFILGIIEKTKLMLIGDEEDMIEA